MSFGFDKIFFNYLPKYVQGYLHVNDNPVNVAHTAFCVNINQQRAGLCKYLAYACLLKANKKKTLNM